MAFFTLPSLADAPRHSPTEIAIDGSGNIYVIMAPDSTAGEGIYVYSPDGKEVASYNAIGYVDFAIGSDGSIYLSNVRLKQVDRLEKNGSFSVILREDRTDRFIDYIAIDRDGNLYVSDFIIQGEPAFNTSGCILKISPAGTVMDVIEGSPIVPLDKPFKFSVSANGTIYLADSNSHIGVIYPDGSRGRIIPSGTINGNGNSQDDRLTDIAVGDDGYLYVTETLGSHVYKLAADGSAMAIWDGCGPLRFYTPSSIATGRDGRVYVSDLLNQRVVWFDGDKYRFGENATGNVAGKGVLWDNVIAADGNMTTQMPVGNVIKIQQDIPGFTSAIALAGLCLACLFLCLRRAR